MRFGKSSSYFYRFLALVLLMAYGLAAIPAQGTEMVLCIGTDAHAHVDLTLSAEEEVLLPAAEIDDHHQDCFDIQLCGHEDLSSYYRIKVNAPQHILVRNDFKFFQPEFPPVMDLPIYSQIDSFPADFFIKTIRLLI
jgi:hypothetical protein